MQIDEATAYIDFLLDKEQDKLIFNRWIVGGYEKDMSFQEFKEALQPIEIKDDDEILDELQELMSKCKCERNEGLNGDI